MKEATVSQTFKCPECGQKTMSLYQWANLPPLGVCTNTKCQVAVQMTTEDLAKLVGIQCENPGCGNNLEDGCGGHLIISVMGPIRISDKGDITHEDHEGLKVEWNVCDDCVEYFTDQLDGKRLKMSVGQWRRHRDKKAKAE